MPTVNVDINTRILSDQHKVYLARPGKQCRLYSNFLDMGYAGPELPDLDLVPGLALDDQPNLFAKIQRSSKIRSWIEGGRDERDRPSFELDQYENTKTASVAHHLGTIRAYFEVAQQGDFAVVFPKNYMEDAVVFEFQEAPLRFHAFDAGWRYGQYDLTLQGRRLRKVGNLSKRFLSKSILEITRQLNSVAVLGRSDAAFIYEQVLSNYVNDDQFNAMLRVSSDEYDIDDDVIIKAFMKYVALNYVHLDQGRDFHTLKDSAFIRLEEDAPELASEIHSPGYHKLSSLLIVPLLFSTLFGCAAEVDPNVLLQSAKEGNLLIGNSAAPPDDPCTAMIGAEIQRWFQLRGIVDEWPETCAHLKEAAERVDASTDVRISVSDGD